MTPKPPQPESPKRTVCAGVLAGRLYEKIVQLRTECEAEIANAPASIRERFKAKEVKAFEAAGAEISELAQRLLGDKKEAVKS